MYTYIIKQPTGDILAVNRTLHGCAMELYGLDAVKFEDQNLSEDLLEELLKTAPSIQCKTSEDKILIVERHFLGN